MSTNWGDFAWPDGQKMGMIAFTPEGPVREPRPEPEPEQDNKRDLSAIESLVAQYGEKHGSSDSLDNTLHDMLADMMHYASREGVHLSWDTAWNHYAAESGRCKHCGQTEQEVIEDTEALEEPEADAARASCGGYEDFFGEVGPHEFEHDDIEEDRRTSA